MVPEQLDICMEKISSTLISQLTQKLTWNRLIDINVKYKIIKFLVLNTGENLCELGVGKDALDMTLIFFS